MALITHLDVGAVQIPATPTPTAWDGDLQGLTWNLELVNSNGKVIDDRYSKAVGTKKRHTFSASLFHRNTTLQTNLDVTVASVGGTDILALVRSGSLRVTTITDEGSGIADAYTYPWAMGTEIELSIEKLVSTSAAFAGLGDGVLTGFAVAVSIAVGGTAFQAPMILTGVVHQIDVDKIQIENCTLSLDGAVTACTGHALVTAIVNGTAATNFSLATGANTYAGNCLVTGCTIDFQDASIVSDRIDFEVQGAPTIT